MFKEHPGHAKLGGQVRRQSLHAEGLGCVMAAVENIQAEVFGERERPVWTFAGDKSVHAFSRGLLHFRARASRHDADAPALSWEQYAEPHVTLVVQNGADRVADIAKALLKAGRDGATPVAVVRDGGSVEQQTLHSTLEQVGQAARAAKHVGAGVVYVGEIIGERTEWFESRPLHGWHILVPRTKDSTADLRALLARFGAVSHEVPTMSVEPPRTPQQMERAIHGLVSGRFEWVEIETEGRAAHGSRPREGRDAIRLMGRVLTALDQLDRTLQARTSHPLLGTASLHASLIEGGRELSSYPDRCHLQMERRTIPGEAPGSAAREVEDILARLRTADPDFKAASRSMFADRKSTRLNSSHTDISRMPSSA